MNVWQWYSPEWQGDAEGAEEFKSAYSDPEFVVEEICERNYGGNFDYSIPCPIMIRKSGDSDWLEFECEVESVPQFSASRRIRA